MTRELNAQVLRILHDVPGLTVVAEPGGTDRRVDAILQFGDQREPVAIEFKRTVNAAIAWGRRHPAVWRSERARRD